MSTNYRNTFITVSPDCGAAQGTVPAKAESVAGLQHALLRERPYAITSDDLLFEVFARRNDIAETDRPQARAAFFAKPQACLRVSPLVKQYGWGLHHDGDGRVALHAVESDDYRRLLARPDLTIVAGMRNRRA
ncbi:DUF6157 family protein [Azospirillum sp.]|uniref:DUF6157 family protein n=1 Tax=Azospirillum sp. TaxID=34012 RepID=UPI003D725E3D